MSRAEIVAVVLICLGAAVPSSLWAGWLSPMNPKARLAAPVTCAAEPDNHPLQLDRGTLIEELEWDRPAQGGSFYRVKVLTGRNRNWVCTITDTGHGVLTIDESPKRAK